MSSQRLQTFLGLLLAFVASAIQPSAANAALSADDLAALGKSTGLDPLGGLSVPQLINRIILQALPLIGALFLLMFIWGGARYLTAGGDSQKVKAATKTLTNAIIGIMIVLGAYIIVSSLISVFGGIAA